MVPATSAEEDYEQAGGVALLLNLFEADPRGRPQLVSGLASASSWWACTARAVGRLLVGR